MSKALLTYTCEVTLRSPFLMKGLSPKAWGLDAAAIRNPNGIPIIPADQIRGIVRDALRDMSKELMNTQSGMSLDQLFGESSRKEEDAGASNDPQRGKIFFSDLEATGLPSPSSYSYTRIKIDEATGTVNDGSLQVVELVAPLGQDVTFTGTIDVVAESNKRDSLRKLLKNALNLIGSVGAIKSSGFGEVVRTNVSEKNVRQLKKCAPQAPNKTDRWRFKVTFDRPILVNSHRLADNAIKSDTVIPGAAFKGALADLLIHVGEKPGEGTLKNALAQLHFSHAFPSSPPDNKPVGYPLPLSLVSVKDEDEDEHDRYHFADALDCERGKGVMINGEPASFQTDWKSGDEEKARTFIGSLDAGHLTWQARTHVAIDAASGAALDEHLFTTHLLNTEGCSWILDIDASKITDPSERQEAVALVETLGKGLYGFSQTGAQVTFELLSDDLSEKPWTEPLTETVRLMLLTPAVLFHAEDAWLTTENTVKDAYEVYKMYFQEHLGATLTNFFAEQQFIGRYQSRRRRAYGKAAYFPFVVTKAGAVFQMTVPSERLNDVQHILRTGLPVARWRDEELTWENCPFVPENGYGAVCLYHPKKGAGVSYV